MVAERVGRDGVAAGSPGPAPASSQAGLVLVVDGDCELCADLAAWVGRRSAVPIRVETGPGGSDAVVVVLDGERHEGADGVAVALSTTGGGAAAVGRLLRRPGLAWLGASVYQRFAKRHRRVARAWVRLRLGRLLRSGTRA